mmetsp:Transcript_19428/g.44258  ORF Transcript_19428/g.44258 Transcript_19428/m.44258 type:complete len:104 (-) Transcript_19428:210-521(-)
MRAFAIISSIFLCLFETSIYAFTAQAPSITSRSKSKPAFTCVNLLGGDGEPPKKLTRENEPEDFFSSKMDKMSDDEKIPVALLGLAGISLPFLLGLAALYAAK